MARHQPPPSTGGPTPAAPVANQPPVAVGKVRWVMLGLVFLAIVINYMDRANLAVALPYMDAELNIDPALSGLVLGAFFWTYAAFQIPAGWLVDRLRSRTMFAIAVAWWSVFTAATAAARGFGSLFGMRLLLGVGEAGAFPAATSVVEKWFPERERGIASGIYDSGARGGTILAIPLVTALIAALGWRGSFMVTGAIGLVWVAVWLWAYHSPLRQRWISKEELAYIKAGGARVADFEEHDDSGPPKVRRRDLLRSRTIWGMAIGYACQSYVIYFFITWFPTYLVEARHLSLLQLGIWGSIPGIVAFAGNFLGGWFSDRLLHRGHSLTFARKSCIIGGMLGSAVIGFVELAPSIVLAIVLLSFSFGCVTFATSCIVALPADIAPRSGPPMAGSIQGFQNTASSIAGIISPFAIGALYGATGAFGWGLGSAAFIAVLGCIAYLFIVGRIHPVDREELIAS